MQRVVLVLCGCFNVNKNSIMQSTKLTDLRRKAMSVIAQQHPPLIQILSPPGWKRTWPVMRFCQPPQQMQLSLSHLKQVMDTHQGPRFHSACSGPLAPHTQAAKTGTCRNRATGP